MALPPSSGFYPLGLTFLGFFPADCFLPVSPCSAAATDIEMFFHAFTTNLRIAVAACLHPFAVHTLLQLALSAFPDFVVVTVELILFSMSSIAVAADFGIQLVTVLGILLQSL